MDIAKMSGEADVAAGGLPALDQKLEVVVIPVTDIDRTKGFYENLGWKLDADFSVGEAYRVVQFTPPGSSCSNHFGKGITEAKSGSPCTLFLVVSDIEAVRAELIARGAHLSGLFHHGVGQPPLAGLHPQRQTYASYAEFSDLDGNTWLLQEVTARLPGRVDGNDATFTSVFDLEGALRRAERAHTEHEKRSGERDANWPLWYADFIIREQTGK